jgi:hypothetical protein
MPTKIYRQEENQCKTSSESVNRKPFDPRINNYAYWVNMCDKQQAELETLEEELNEAYDNLSAWVRRCYVAEDLNKVYVRMYLEMQDKYDRLAKLCLESNDNLN